MSHIPIEIKGDKTVTSLIVQDISSKTTKELSVDGVFVEIGYEVDTSIVKGLVKLTEKNEIITDKECKTSEPAIFAAGDVTTTPYKQTVISAGEGAVAALSCHKYLTLGKESRLDWK